MTDSRNINDANDALVRGIDIRAALDRSWQPEMPLNSVETILNGAERLSFVRDYLTRFVSYPSEHERTAHVLWIAHAHSIDAWDSTPRLAFLSPEPGSGKTRALEVTELLVPRPVEAVNVTAPYLFRKVGDPDGKPTILFDEIDTVFGPRARGNEEIRGLLNAGHRKGAVAGRCVVKGKIIETEEISAYCAVALAGLGNLPDTIMSRSVIIRMRRRASGERVEPYRRRVHGLRGQELHRLLAEWTGSILSRLADARPLMPPEVQDRDADVWEALLAIAEAAGGEWPDAARRAAVALVTQKKQNSTSLGVRLLADVRTIFCDHGALTTETILKGLHNLEESPWRDMKGRDLDARRLSKILSQYSIKPKTIRFGSDSVSRGYEAADLRDAWLRYLPSS
jgi:hypothetical protein